MSNISERLGVRVAGKPGSSGCSRSNAGEPTGLILRWSVARRPDATTSSRLMVQRWRTPVGSRVQQTGEPIAE